MSEEEPYLNPKVVADFVDMMEAELHALRAWKEKARPFLELCLAEYRLAYDVRPSLTIEKNIATLTELLKEATK